ncbi:MAG: hypothetical protein JXR73_11090 [Candidatus Omnitrophica bacterium]|nr:hypothetical protein [Candidatus Omnitrophota bacterium]
MKHVMRSMLLGMLGLLIAANTTMAQQRSFRSQTALIICDVLLLNQEKSEKVIAAYDEVRQALRDQGGRPDFQSMSDDERVKYFEKRQKDTADALKKELKDTLSEKELEAMETVMMQRIYTPVAELRGLRQVELKEDQCSEIQPLAIALSKKIVPGGSRFMGQPMDEAEREKAEKAFAEAKKDFIAKVTAILSEEQNASWKENTSAAQKEIDEMMERRRNFQRQ